MPPAILFGLVLATLYGCAFHVAFGRRFWQWPLFWAASVAGFFGGYAVGALLDVELWRVGVLPLFACTVGSAILLAIAWFFSAERLPAFLTRSGLDERSN